MNEKFQADQENCLQGDELPRLEVSKQPSDQSGKSPEKLQSSSNYGQSSPEKELALSNKPNSEGREMLSPQPSMGLVHMAQLQEVAAMRKESSPNRLVLYQAPSFGCLVQKQLSVNARSPLRSPPQVIASDSYSGQSNIFFNGNLVDVSSQHENHNLINQAQVQLVDNARPHNFLSNEVNRVIHSQLEINKQSVVSRLQSSDALHFGSADQAQEEQKVHQRDSPIFSVKQSSNSLAQSQDAAILSHRQQQQESQSLFSGQSMNQNALGNDLHQLNSHSPQQPQQIGIPVGTITTVNLNSFRISSNDQQIHHPFTVPIPMVQYQQQPMIQNSSFLYGNARNYIEQYVQMQPADIFGQANPYLILQNQGIQQNSLPNIQHQQIQNSGISLLSQNQMFSSLVAQQFSQSDLNSVLPQLSVQAALSEHSSHVSNQRMNSNISNQANHNQFQQYNPAYELVEERRREENPFHHNQDNNGRIIVANQVQARNNLQNQYQIKTVNDAEVSDRESVLSDLSSIPSEHEQGLNFNEYIRRYALQIVTITWNRDSHGLFDFEMRQLARETFEVTDQQNFVRLRECCKLLKPDQDIRKEFQKRAQLLMSIKQYRNRFNLVTPVKYMLKNSLNAEEVKQIQERDVESFYSEIGEQLLQPYDMCERMYLVVRSIINDQNVHQDYQLQKGDIIKVGRAKFLVRDINIRSQNKKVKQKNEKILRLRKGYAEKIARERRSASVNNDQSLSQVLQPFSNIDAVRQPLHREARGVIQERTRNRTVAGSQTVTTRVADPLGPLGQRDLSIGGATQFTEEFKHSQEERKDHVEEEIQYPQNLELADDNKSSNDSDWLKNYQSAVEGEQDKDFKKIIKRYVDLEMAPLNNGDIPHTDQLNVNQAEEFSSSFQNKKDVFEKINKQIDLKQNGSCQVEKEQSQPIQPENKQSDAVGLDCSSAYCRFCWANEHDNINPLISSCNCSGGVRFVHFDCLKTWIKTKMATQENSKLRMYFWKTFECEICKSVFPTRFKTQNGLKYSLFDFKIDKSRDYLMLEGINADKSTSKLIYLLLPNSANCQFKMGRANDQDVRINDISVSRQHATINFQNDKFFIKDNLSKFGTLIQIQNQLEIKPKQTRILQVGRTIMNVSLKPLRRKEPHNSQILWQENKKELLIKRAGQQTLINDQKILQNNKRNVNDMCKRINNTENYIRQQSDLHRRQIEHINVDNANAGYNIERRQLNLNLDDFYNNLAKDESSESDDDHIILNNRRRQIEESKSFAGASRPNQFEERKVGPLQAERLNPRFIQPQLALPQQRVIPNGRIFIDLDQNAQQSQQRQPNELNNNRLQFPHNKQQYFRSNQS